MLALAWKALGLDVTLARALPTDSLVKLMRVFFYWLHVYRISGVLSFPENDLTPDPRLVASPGQFHPLSAFAHTHTSTRSQLDDTDAQINHSRPLFNYAAIFATRRGPTFHAIISLRRAGCKKCDQMRSITIASEAW